MRMETNIILFLQVLFSNFFFLLRGRVPMPNSAQNVFSEVTPGSSQVTIDTPGI